MVSIGGRIETTGYISAAKSGQLFAYFIDQASTQIGGGSFAISDAVRRRLADHDWPGNVRELRDFAFSAVLGLFDDDATLASRDSSTLAERVNRFEAAAIRDALALTRGDIAMAMGLLDLPRKTLYDKMKRHGIRPDAFRRHR